MFSLRQVMTAGLLTAGALGLLTAPSGAATSGPATVGRSHAVQDATPSITVPNDNIVKVAGSYVFDPTTITGFKISRFAFNHCQLSNVSFTITNKTSITQQIKFTRQHGGSNFGAPVPPGGKTGVCVDVVSSSPNEFTLASNPSARLSDIIVRRP
jgi:hypothetical protein